MSGKTVVDFPGFSKSEDRAEVLHDVARHARSRPDDFDGMMIVAVSDVRDLVLWTRGLTDLEIIGLLERCKHMILLQHGD